MSSIPKLAIAWPLEVTQLSERDSAFAMIDPHLP